MRILQVSSKLTSAGAGNDISEGSEKQTIE